MALSAFDDKSHPPEDGDLAEVLGRAFSHWEALLAHMDERHGPVRREWGFAGAKWGWSLRLKHGKRNLLYLTPIEGHFLVGTALGAKARDGVLAGRVSAATRRILEEAPRYAEGYGVRVPVRTLKDLAVVKRIAAAKVGG